MQGKYSYRLGDPWDLVDGLHAPAECTQKVADSVRARSALEHADPVHWTALNLPSRSVTGILGRWDRVGPSSRTSTDATKTSPSVHGQSRYSQPLLV